MKTMLDRILLACVACVGAVINGLAWLAGDKATAIG
jgi:hypothetical protein